VYVFTVVTAAKQVKTWWPRKPEGREEFDRFILSSVKEKKKEVHEK
jgi:hypothetical protein